MTVLKIIAIYFIIINLVGFFIMGIDKQKAKNQAWRIPEATLFSIAIFGGSIGTTLGMFAFHHKTRHWYFLYGMPLIIVLQIVLLYFIMHSATSIIIIM